MEGQRAAVYTRLSQDRSGERIGVERQERLCREHAKAEGWSVVDVFEDNDTSASRKRPRPEYERLLDQIRAGRIDVIICWHVDRLYRQLRDLEELVELAEKHQVGIAAVKSGTLDLSTASGRMSARLFAVL